MSDLAADLAVLRRAYAQGVLKVRFPDGRETLWPSGDDLLKRIRSIEADIDRQASGVKSQRVGHVSFRRD